MGHRISTRDIMIDDLDDLFRGEKADCLYTDPPWGLGLIKYFRTLNGQKGINDDWFAFLGRIKYLYERHVSGPLFLEIGIKTECDLIKVFGTPDARYVKHYGSGSNKRPNILLCWGAVPAVSPADTNCFEAPVVVLSSLSNKPKSVFDCCIGTGATAKACKKTGVICYANELNPKRAQKTMQILDFEQV